MQLNHKMAPIFLIINSLKSALNDILRCYNWEKYSIMVCLSVHYNVVVKLIVQRAGGGKLHMHMHYAQCFFLLASSYLTISSYTCNCHIIMYFCINSHRIERATNLNCLVAMLSWTSFFAICSTVNLHYTGRDGKLVGNWEQHYKGISFSILICTSSLKWHPFFWLSTA